VKQSINKEIIQY